MGMYCKLLATSDAVAQNLLNHPAKIHGFIQAHDRYHDLPEAIELGKSWHGLHFTLTQSDWTGALPLNFLMSGQTVGEEDLGYGPARVLLASATQKVGQAIAGFSDADFERKFNPEAMAAAEIYPSIWDEPQIDLLTEYREYFNALKEFMQCVADKGQAIVILMR